MQFRFSHSLRTPPNAKQPAPNGLRRTLVAAGKSKLAATSSDSLTVHLFDTVSTASGSSTPKDKFPTKSARDPPAASYSLTDIQLSSDESKVAVAQSDGGLFIYKVGSQWGDKKSICNKFSSVSGAAISCMHMSDSSVVFGCIDGSVHLALLKSNKSQVIYDGSNSGVIALAVNDRFLYTSHADGTVYRFKSLSSGGGYAFDRVFFQCGGGETVTCLAVDPVASSDSSSVLLGCGDGRVVVLNQLSQHIDEFDFGSDVSEFTHAVSSKNSAVFVSSGRLDVFSSSGGKWSHSTQVVDGLSVVTGVSFVAPFLYLANITGSVVVFEMYSNKVRFGDYYLSQSADSCVATPVNRDSGRGDFQVTSNYEFVDGQVCLDRFCVAFTTSTLVIADMLSSGRQSEVSWLKSGKEQFYFGHEGYCIISQLEECSILELGKNEVSFTVSTTHFRKLRMSITESAVAYVNGGVFIQMANRTFHEIPHQIAVDIVALSFDSQYLLYRDKSHALFIYDINSRSKQAVCSNARFIQWISGCQVFVVQSRMELIVCYTPANPTSLSKHEISGDVSHVEKHEGKTRVVIRSNPPSYIYLDDSKTDFVSAVDQKKFRKAAIILENIGAEPSLWQILLGHAVDAHDLLLMQRCYAGMCDIAGVRFIAGLLKSCEELEDKGVIDPGNHYSIKARLALLHNQYKLAESYYLEQGRIDDAMEMYQEIHQWDKAIQIAESRNHPNLMDLKANYQSW
eukprot:Partr_v1_DN28926_c0_g1_i3_m26019 putative intraflagellar transport 172 homolog (Chlamydomonas)